MTKSGMLQQLFEMMETGKIMYELEQALKRTVAKVNGSTTFGKNDTKLQMSQEEKKVACESQD